MIVYLYDAKTSEYVREFCCQQNPARPGEYLTPPFNTTPEKPPTPNKNQAVIFDNGWRVVPDFRGSKYWLPDGNPHEILDYGIEPPDGALTERPAPTPEQIAQQKHQEWKATRQKQVDAIVVEIDGLPFDGDETSQGRMLRAATLADSPDDLIRWILADNRVVEVTAEQLKRATKAAGLKQEALWLPPESSVQPKTKKQSKKTSSKNKP